MTDNQPGRRPLGPPPTSLNSAPEPAPVPPETQAGATPSAWKKAVPVVAAGVLAVLLWPMVSSKFSEQFSGSDEPADTPVAARDESVYDFTRSVSRESPLGPLSEVTIKVPESLAATVPGYAEGRYLDAVTISNVQYTGSNPGGWIGPASLCSVDLAFDWHEGVLERELADSAVGGVNVIDYEKVLRLVGTSPESFQELEFGFSDNWSTASATVECYRPADFSAGGSGAAFAFKYDVSDGGDGTESRTLARAPVVFTDNGKLFITEGWMGPNLEGWAPDGEGQWVEVYGQ